MSPFSKGRGDGAGECLGVGTTRRVALLIALLLMVAWQSPASGDPLIISEFMASNDRVLFDKLGDTPDWIEVHNVTADVVNTDGWYLTDEADRLTKWRLPSVDIEPKGFLVVFASGKDRADPNDELHTNFRLSGSGDYLALVAPDGRTATTQFRPFYPPQSVDISFGRELEVATTPLVESGQTTKFFVPVDDSLGLTWTAADFDDTSWESAVVPIGYDRKVEPTYDGLISTDIETSMFESNSTVYVRIPFQVDAPLADGSALVLRMQYDDGFVAYINGQEVVQRNAPSALSAFGRTTVERADDEARDFEVIDVSAVRDAIRPGMTNVLAIHGLNRGANDDDFYVSPEVGVVVALGMTSGIGFFSAPTPGWPNDRLFPSVAAFPVFSIGSGVIPEGEALELSSTLGEVRYTTDGSRPHRFSALYTEPIQIDRSMVVRARTFADGLVASPDVQQLYSLVQESLLGFDSNLPLVVFNSYQRFDVQEDGLGFSRGHLFTIERGFDGRTRFGDAPIVAEQARFRSRGESSSRQKKKNWNVEVQNPDGSGRSVEILGMPSESDWVFYAPHDFEASLMRNVFIYELGNQLNRYAPRTRFAEVFVNFIDEPLSEEHYMGVYVIMEKIKRDEQRINIARLDPDQTTEPEISGGYVLKFDWVGGNNTDIEVDGVRVAIDYPIGSQISQPQIDWMKDYLGRMAVALNQPETTDPTIPISEKSYSEFVDADSWIDYHFLQEYAVNTDGLGLSTYFFKDRNKPIEGGPLWDFDRALASRYGGGRGTDGWGCKFGGSWWGPLFSDVVFWRRYQERYLNARPGVLAAANLQSIVDRAQAEIGEAAERNFARWGEEPLFGDTWEEEVALLREWVANRVAWIDTQFISAPAVSAPGGLVPEGLTLDLSVDREITVSSCEPGGLLTPPDAEIYYTINATDPKGADEQPTDQAILYSGESVTVTGNTLVRARTFAKGWSALTEVGFVTSLKPLVVTEIMYNPAREPRGSFRVSDFEYMEFQNVGDEPIEIAGVTVGWLTRATFSGEDIFGDELTVLQPGEYAVAVRDLDAFAFRHDATGVNIVGLLDNRALANAGQEIIVFGPFGEELLRFNYDGTWFPSANGGGRSLVIIDPKAPRETWSEMSSWRPSTADGGSPGRGEVRLAISQRPGDFTQDGGVDIGDVIGVIRFLFVGGAFAPCGGGAGTRVLGDVNGDANLDISDPIYLLRYLFNREAPPTLGLQCVSIDGCPAACN